MTDAEHSVLRALLRDAAVTPPPGLGLDPAEWGAIVARAETELLAPLLRRRVRRAGLLERVPESVRARLERHTFLVAARTLLLGRALADVLAALRDAGIRAAPLRGPALGERLYGDAALRPCGDVDVLVDRADLAGVQRALAPLGFREVDRRAGFARRFSYALELVEDGHGVVVEPHFALGYPPYVDALDLRRVWARARPARVSGVETLALAPEATLLNLCLHVIHKTPAVPLLWLYDLDQLVRQEGAALDWTEFAALARDSRMAPLVATTLREATRLFATPVDGPTLSELGEAAASRLARLLGPASVVDGKESLAVLLALPGVGARLRYAGAVLFPSPRFMTLEYGLTHRRQLGAAYVRRASYFTWQGLKGLLRLCS